MSQIDTTPQMKQTLGLRAVVFFGLAYMGPLIGIGVFGVIATESSGAPAGSMLLATAAILLTALSYGKMAKHFPASGSAYTYVRKTIGAKLGFMVGWAILLDYLFIPLVIWLVGAVYLEAEFPSMPKVAWLTIFIVASTVINIIGIKVADRVNVAAIVFQVSILGIYILLALRRILSDDGGGALFSLDPLLGVQESLGPIASGAAIAAYVFLGFDAVSTLSEETKNAEKNIPRGIILVALVGGAIFVTVIYLLSIIEPGVPLNADTAGSDIAKTIGGDLFASFFLAAIISQQFNAGIAAQASTARLTYAMGRDGLFPRSIFGKLSARFLTPVYGILVCGMIGFGAAFLSLSTSTSFINFGAFLGFTMVNVAVIAYYIRNRDRLKLNPLQYVILPLAGAAVDIYLLTALDGRAQLVGGIWLALGFGWLLVLTRGSSRPPPEMHMEGAAAPAVRAANQTARSET
ncbi:APC family permease [Phycicoccus sp.]|uniref:APC family permease n=1 Tax=Phycicoccus sp. TaxID=1902410 RepID=UPI002C707E48|nr:APC family permease [Phycicoccus sp.]HMM94052.1 APC family permease [Phycicoccus sp.]